MALLWLCLVRIIFNLRDYEFVRVCALPPQLRGSLYRISAFLPMTNSSTDDSSMLQVATGRTGLSNRSAVPLHPHRLGAYGIPRDAISISASPVSGPLSVRHD